ncbi:MAG: hypothetical protein ACK5RW_01870, partial [bacterium]
SGCLAAVGLIRRAGAGAPARARRRIDAALPGAGHSQALPRRRFRCRAAPHCTRACGPHGPSRRRPQHLGRHFAFSIDPMRDLLDHFDAKYPSSLLKIQISKK